MPIVVGGEEDRPAIGRPDRFVRPAVQVPGERPLGAGREIDGHEPGPLGNLGASARDAERGHAAAVRGARRRVVPRVAGREDARLARRHVIGDELLRHLGDRAGVVPRGDDRPAVRRDVAARLLEGERGRAGLEIAWLGQARLRAGRHLGREEMPPARGQPVVPVADRVVVLEQECRDACLPASLRALGVVGEGRRPHVDAAPKRDDRCPPGRDQPVHPALGRDEQAGLAALRGQQPQRLDRPIGFGLRVGIRPRRGEEERAVGQERGPACFARNGSREAPGRDRTGRVHLPERRRHLRALGIGSADRHDEAPPIRAQPE